MYLWHPALPCYWNRSLSLCTALNLWLASAIFGAPSLGTALTYLGALQEACGARMRVCSAATGGAGPGALQLACTRI